MKAIGRNLQKTEFTQIRNTFLRDPNISGIAKAVLAVWLSHSGEWVLNHEYEIENHFKESKHMYWKATRELRALGYVRYSTIKEKGRIVQHLWEYSDQPQFAPYPDLLDMDKQYIKNTKRKNTKESIYDGREGDERSEIPSPSHIDSGGLSHGYTFQDWYKVAVSKGLDPKLDSTGTKFSCLCPVHKDTVRSLSVATGDSRPVIWKCHAGCPWDAVQFYMFPQLINQTSKDYTFTYTNEIEEPIFRIRRSKKDKSKAFTETKLGKHWVLGLKTDPVIYRLHKINKAISEAKPIYLVEGEKDVETAESIGLTATCNPFGANSWRGSYSKYFKKADVIVIVDKDSAGMDWANNIKITLAPVVKSIKFMQTSLNAKGSDLTDHIQSGRGIADLKEIEI